jgi:RNA polymerase sigma-70 factor (ECF subfamily)
VKETVRQLIIRAQDGDTSAFHELVAMHDERIMILAYQLTKNEQDAEDLYQEVFLKAFKKLHQFRFESEFFTWLYRITVNTAHNYWRRTARLQTYEVESDGGRDPLNWIAATDSPSPEHQEILLAVREAVARLPHQQRTVFILKHLQGLKIQDVAKILDLSEGTIKKYLFRAVEKLRKALKEYQYV